MWGHVLACVLPDNAGKSGVKSNVAFHCDLPAGVAIYMYVYMYMYAYVLVSVNVISIKTTNYKWVAKQQQQMLH